MRGTSLWCVRDCLSNPVKIVESHRYEVNGLITWPKSKALRVYIHRKMKIN